MNLRSYFKETQNLHPSSSAILGSGEFRKKGARVKNWKIRSYYIKDDQKLLYFDPVTKEPKGILDISDVELSIGPTENLNKSGCSNFSNEKGHSVYLSTPAKSMEIVFDTTRAAKNFCSQLLLVSSKNRTNIMRFLKAMKWEDIDGKYYACMCVLIPDPLVAVPILVQRPISQPQGVSFSSSSIDPSLIDDDDEYDDEYDITTTTEGEVDGFIKLRPTVDELLCGEVEARSRSRSLPSSSNDDEFSGGRIYSNSVTPIPCGSSGHTTLMSGRFYKQGGSALSLAISSHSSQELFENIGNFVILKFGSEQCCLPLMTPTPLCLSAT
jgi:hypothetical protein